MIPYFYKMTFDTSLYCALAVFFLRYISGPDYKTNLYTFALLLAANLLCVFSGRLKSGVRAAQLFCACLPGVALFWEHGTAGLFVFLIPWGYMAAAIIRQRYDVYYLNFKDTFRYVMFVFLIPFLLFFYDSSRGIPALSESAPFLLVFFTSGVMLLQVLRYAPQSKDKLLYEKHQVRQMAVFFLLCLAVTAGGIFQAAGDFLWEKVVRQIFLGMTGGIWYVVQWGLLQFQKIKGEEYHGPQEDANTGIAPTGIPVQEQPGEEGALPDAGQPIDVTPVFVVAGILAAILLFVLLRGSVRQGKKTAAIREEREELRKAGEKPVRLKKHSKDPDLVVRYQYRSFMRKADGGRGRLKRSDTTRQIGDKYDTAYAKKDGATGEITRIYREVRYGGRKAGRQEARRMKELVKGEDGR